MIRGRKSVRYYLAMLIISSSFFLVACDVYDLDSFEGTGEDGITGTQAVHMAFIPGSTPSIISEREPYNMQLRIENRGSIDIEEGYLDLSFDRQMFELLNRDDIDKFSLKGTDGAFKGEDKVREIRMSSKELQMQDTSQSNTNIRINACYEYGTRFEGTMCLDGNLLGDVSNKACRMGPISGGEGQGAPVVVERIEPRGSMGSNGANIDFDVYIDNAASGSVLSSGSAQRICNSEINTEDFGIIDIVEITISSFRLSEGDIRCDSHTSEANQFDLSSDKDYISCRISEEIPAEDGTFTTPITMDLEYAYLQTMDTGVTVRAR